MKISDLLTKDSILINIKLNSKSEAIETLIELHHKRLHQRFCLLIASIFPGQNLFLPGIQFIWFISVLNRFFCTECSQVWCYIHQGFVDVHTLNPRILVGHLSTKFVSLSVILDQLTVHLPVLFIAHANG